MRWALGVQMLLDEKPTAGRLEVSEHLVSSFTAGDWAQSLALICHALSRVAPASYTPCNAIL